MEILLRYLIAGLVFFLGCWADANDYHGETLPVIILSVIVLLGGLKFADIVIAIIKFLGV